jgi:hypothetical protein
VRRDLQGKAFYHRLVIGVADVFFVIVAHFDELGRVPALGSGEV